MAQQNNLPVLGKRIGTAACAVVLMFSATHPAAHAASGVAQTLPPVTPGGVVGDINFGGSSTVNLLTDKMAEKFAAEGYAGKITIAKANSGPEIAKFCAGETDVLTSVRAINPKEIEACEKNGRPIVAMVVAFDAVVFTVSRRNEDIIGITREQAAGIYSGSSKNWRDVNSGWINQQIRAYSASPGMGTYDYVSDQLFSSAIKDEKIRRAVISDTHSIAIYSEFPAILRRVTGETNAIGYVPYTFYERNRSRLRALEFEGKMANDVTVGAGTYPLTRKLYMITSPAVLKNKPQVAAFVSYYLTNLPAVARPIGFFPPASTILDENTSGYMNAVK